MSAIVNSLGARAQVLILVLIYERIFAFVLSRVRTGSGFGQSIGIEL